MLKNRRVVLFTVIYVFIIAFIFYNYSKLQYNRYLDISKQEYNSLINQIDVKIELAKEQQEVLSAIFNDLKNDDLKDLLNDKDYFTVFNYSYSDIKSPYIQANYSDDKINWIKQMYNSDLQTVILNSDENLETISIGSRYGSFNSMYSGVVGLTVDLRLLVDNLKDASPDALIIISNQSGDILYHENYIDASKPNIGELYSAGKIISSVDDPYTISKVGYKGDAYIVFRSALTENKIIVTYVLPWQDVFYQWQLNAISLLLLLILISYIVFKYVKNSMINNEIKKILNVKSRFIDQDTLSLLHDNLAYKSETATYFELELIPLIDALRVLSQRRDTKSVELSAYVLNFLNQKIALLTAHTRQEIRYENPGIMKFEISDILEMVSSILEAIAEDRGKNLNFDMSGVISQEVFSYPNAIWIIILSIFDELTHHHEAIRIKASMRGTLKVQFKVDYILNVDEVKLSRLATLIRDKYNASLDISDDEITFDWPIIKQNHLPQKSFGDLKYIVACGYKLNFATERILKIIASQIQLQVHDFRDKNHYDVVFIEASMLNKMSDEDFTIINQFKYVIMFYDHKEHAYYKYADRVGAKAVLPLPLESNKLKAILNAYLKEQRSNGNPDV